jgi:hypothetical protein
LEGGEHFEASDELKAQEVKSQESLTVEGKCDMERTALPNLVEFLQLSLFWWCGFGMKSAIFLTFDWPFDIHVANAEIPDLIVMEKLLAIARRRRAVRPSAGPRKVLTTLGPGVELEPFPDVAALPAVAKGGSDGRAGGGASARPPRAAEPTATTGDVERLVWEVSILASIFVFKDMHLENFGVVFVRGRFQLVVFDPMPAVKLSADGVPMLDNFPRLRAGAEEEDDGEEEDAEAGGDTRVVNWVLMLERVTRLTVMKLGDFGGQRFLQNMGVLMNRAKTPALLAAVSNVKRYLAAVAAEACPLFWDYQDFGALHAMFAGAAIRDIGDIEKDAETTQRDVLAGVRAIRAAILGRIAGRESEFGWSPQGTAGVDPRAVKENNEALLRFFEDEAERRLGGFFAWEESLSAGSG